MSTESAHEGVSEPYSGRPGGGKGHSGTGGMGDPTGHFGKEGDQYSLRAERKRHLPLGGHRSLDTRLSEQSSDQELLGSAQTVHLYTAALKVGR